MGFAIGYFFDLNGISSLKEIIEFIAVRGSHRQYKHPLKTGRVTIAGHPNDDLAPGTLNGILKQAKIKEVK